MNTFFRIGIVGVIALAMAYRAPLIHAQPTPAAAPAAAPDAPDQSDEAEALIEPLLEELTGTDDAARQKAHNQLVQLGDAAIPVIKKYMRGPHLPISVQRAQAVLDELEIHFKFQPTMVTVKMTNVHPREVFKELSKQGGISIEPQYDFWNQNWGNGGPAKKISIDIANQPFWQAMIEVCGKAQVNFTNNGQGQTISLYPGGGQTVEGIRFFSGPVLYVATNITRDVHLKATTKPVKSLTLHVEAYVDPKITVLGHAGEIMATEATGDAGNSLLANWQKLMSPDNGNGNFSIGLTTPLVYDTGKNTRIASFKGTGRFKISSSKQTLEFPDPLQAKGKKVTGGDWEVTLKNYSKNDGGYDVTIVADRKSGADERINWWMVNMLHLFDAQGNQYGYQNRGGSYGGTHMEYSAHFSRPPGAGDPTKLVFEPILTTRNIRIPVEFKDIPLPIPE